MSLATIYKKEAEKRLPIKVWKVKSLTNFNPDLNEFYEYDVELWADGKWYCNCWGFRGRKKECKHIKQIKAEQQLKLN